eukprot:5197638-Pleurochrysis_carterae.AAC.1
MSADDEGTLAQRLSRRRRMPATVVASDLLAEPVLTFIIYLCSGAERAGDLAGHLPVCKRFTSTTKGVASAMA